MATRIFVSFDGAIAAKDVGNAFLEESGGRYCRQPVQRYRQGSIGGIKRVGGDGAALEPFDPDEADRFVRSFPIDQTFGTFLSFSHERECEVVVVSEGSDYHIGKILDRLGVSGIPVFANKATFLPAGDRREGVLSMSHPYSDFECSRCSCCKRNIMLTRSGDEDVIVFVGAGYSDACPARYADVVFARSSLQAYCQQENITYYPYTTFDDIAKRMEKMTAGGKRIRKRKRAELERREAFRLE